MRSLLPSFFDEATPLGARVENDFYPTPLADIQALLELLDEHGIDVPKGGNILEPGAGDGRIAYALKRKFPGATVHAVELEEARRTDLLRRADVVSCPEDFRAYVRAARRTGLKFDLIGGNPPYSMAFEFVQSCYDLLVPSGVLAFLLPLSILASQTRRDWMEAKPPWGQSVRSERPKFRWGGSAQTDYAWFVWTNGGRGPQWIEVR